MSGAFGDDAAAAEFAEAWMAAAADATGDDWRIDDGADGVVLLQEFRSAKGNPDPDAVHGAVYCSVPSRRRLADFLFLCAKDGTWPLQGMKGCSSPEEAMLRFAASGVVP